MCASCISGSIHSLQQCVVLLATLCSFTYVRILEGHAGTADLPRTSDAACGVRVSRAREGIPIVQIGGEDTSVQQQGPGACAAPVNL